MGNLELSPDRGIWFRSMRKAPRIYAAVCAVLVFSGQSQLWALEIRGTVQTVSGNVATVVTEGDVVPATGDRAEIFSKAGGSVASGKVIGRKETTVTVQITNVTGTITKNQLVRFTSGGGVEWKRQHPDDVPNTFNEAQSMIEAQRRNATKGFAGRWKVQNENASYVLELQERGGRITGTYDLQGGSLDGAVRGGTLYATWKQPGNRRGGSVALQLSADGNTLTGPWEYNPATFSSGLRGSGAWTFRRVSR